VYNENHGSQFLSKCVSQGRNKAATSCFLAKRYGKSPVIKISYTPSDLYLVYPDWWFGIGFKPMTSRSTGCALLSRRSLII